MTSWWADVQHPRPRQTSSLRSWPRWADSELQLSFSVSAIVIVTHVASWLSFFAKKHVVAFGGHTFYTAFPVKLNKANQPVITGKSAGDLTNLISFMLRYTAKVCSFHKQREANRLSRPPRTKTCELEHSYYNLFRPSSFKLHAPFISYITCWCLFYFQLRDEAFVQSSFFAFFFSYTWIWVDFLILSLPGLLQYRPQNKMII